MTIAGRARSLCCGSATAPVTVGIRISPGRYLGGREGVPLDVIQRQLGYANLGTTSIYLQDIGIKRSSSPPTPGAP
jgi:hypothetical protein